jgi:hypothetical protein
LFSVAVIMHALTPVGPVPEDTWDIWHPAKVRRVPPEDRPSLERAMGYSSQLRPVMLGASPHANRRLVSTIVASSVRVNGSLKLAPGRPEA